MAAELLRWEEAQSAELTGAARDVLNVMFFSDIVEEGCDFETARPFPIQVRVRFGGDRRGEFRMEVDETAAAGLAVSFLGSDPVTRPNAREIGEVMGELGNMICGAFLSRFVQEGMFTLSAPEVVRPAVEDLPGLRQGLAIMEGRMELRVHWESAAG